MKSLFVRIDETKFFILQGMSRNPDDKRLLRVLAWHLRWRLPQGKVFDRQGKEFEYGNEWKRIISYARRHPEYCFWSVFELSEEVSYNYDDTLGEVFEDKREGATLLEVVPKVKKLLGWQELSRCK